MSWRRVAFYVAILTPALLIGLAVGGPQAAWCVVLGYVVGVIAAAV